MTSSLSNTLYSKGFDKIKHASYKNSLLKEEIKHKYTLTNRDHLYSPTSMVSTNRNTNKSNLLKSSKYRLSNSILSNNKNIKNNELNSFLKSMISVDKNNKNLTDDILKIKNEIINNEKLIKQLEEELNYSLNINEKIQAELYMTTIRKNTSQISEKKAELYCIGIKKKFKLVVETIEYYENIIFSLKEDKKLLIEEYNNKIYQLEEDKNKLINDKEDLYIKMNYQKDYIVEIENKHKDVLDQKLKQQEYFKSKQQEDIERYNDLNIKYCELKEKLDYYAHDIINKDIEQVNNKNLINEIDKEHENAKMYDNITLYFIFIIIYSIFNDKKILIDTVNEEINNLNKEISETLKSIEILKKKEASNKKKSKT